MRLNMTNLVPAIVAAVMFAVVIILVWDYPRAANRLLLIMGVVGIILAAILVVREIIPKRKQDSLEKAKEGRYSVAGKKLPVTFAWVVGIVPLVYLLGFTVGISLYTFFYYKRHGGKWLPSIVLGLTMAAVVYLGFVLGMGIKFPRPVLLPFLRW